MNSWPEWIRSAKSQGNFIRPVFTVLIPGLFMHYAWATPSSTPNESGLRGFTSALQHIHREYVDPVRSHALLEQAMQGLLKTSGLSLARVGLPPAALTIEDEQRTSGPEQIPFASLRAFTQLYSAIKAADPSLDDARLFEGAIRGMLSGLDERSDYLDAETVNALKPGQPGTAAIGLEITKKDGVIRVVAPLEDSPAARSGLAAGDEIDAIDGNPLKDVPLARAVNLLRGRAGTTVVLSVTNTAGEKTEISIQRQVIVPMRVTGRLVGQNIAYVRIGAFHSGTARELNNQLTNLEESSSGNLNGLILDLRNNPGGVLAEAVLVADEFVADGQLVSVQGRTAASSLQFTATKNRQHPTRETVPMVVLVDGGTASGSEIVAAALQDYRRAVIVGSNTYGLATVQTLFPLPNGGALKLTTGQVLRPSKGDIHRHGVIPDVCVRGEKTVSINPENPADPSVCPQAMRHYHVGEPDFELEFAADYLKKQSSGAKLQ